MDVPDGSAQLPVFMHSALLSLMAMNCVLYSRLKSLAASSIGVPFAPITYMFKLCKGLGSGSFLEVEF